MLIRSVRLVTAFKIYILLASMIYGVDPEVLEGICSWESDNGRVLKYHNKNGTWDVGYCMNNTPKSRKVPHIPSMPESIFLAAKELTNWKKIHNYYCVYVYNKTKRCKVNKWGKWWGTTYCWRPHPWWEHYNHGYKIIRNNYGKKVQCLINNKYRCSRNKWQKIRFTSPSRRVP